MHKYNTTFIKQLIAPWRGDQTIIKELEEFSKHLGWYPSDIIEDKNPNNPTTGHLFVEHGLENSAVISFINAEHLFKGLTALDRQSLLGISYNNLVDLHISVDRKNISGIHNRLGLNDDLIHFGEIENERNLKSSTYTEIFKENRFRPIYKSLDDSLIETISYWKRLISSELSNSIDNEKLAIFFNAIIFIRAIEDYEFSKDPQTGSRYGLNKIVDQYSNKTFSEIVGIYLGKSTYINIPESVINFDALKEFNSLSSRTLYQIFSDFYKSKYSNYDYDFSIISKHALSRLYERYVSILEVKESKQLSFLPSIPEEKFNKNSGTYYTPQFIARFFNKFLEKNIENIFEKDLNILEPAVGSGIFIRTFLERQIEFSKRRNITTNVFDNIFALDKNPMACHAAELSLSLLHLVSYDKFPEKKLRIYNEDSLTYFADSGKEDTFDIIISNPPYVKYNSLNDKNRAVLKHFLGDLNFGKTDLYLAFIHIAIKSLKEGGYGCYVLPNTFLTTDSAKKIRQELSDNFTIKCIVDLSINQQRIFEEAGVYPILLIFEKLKANVPAIIAKIQDNTGEAIHNILSDNFIQNDSFSIYEVNQTFFSGREWFLLPPTEYRLTKRLSDYSKIEDFFEVRTGFSTGHTEAFIFDENKIPKGEDDIFKPYMEDRLMDDYISKNKPSKFVFYPFLGSQKISEDDLVTKFKKTYQLLTRYKHELSQRTEVKSGKIPWWRPNRPRSPKFMMVPKIMTPHLVFTPKFNIDLKGQYATSRSPYLVPKSEFDDEDLLYYFSGVLNSSVCFWYLLSHAPKYQNGFAMLEPTYIKNLPVPNPLTSDNHGRRSVQKIVKLVKHRMLSSGIEKIDLEKKIDDEVSSLFNLSEGEKEFLNI